MYSSRSGFDDADKHAAQVLRACCVVSVMTLCGCSYATPPAAANDNDIYPSAAHSAPADDSDRNCIEDDFC